MAKRKISRETKSNHRTGKKGAASRRRLSLMKSLCGQTDRQSSQASLVCGVGLRCWIPKEDRREDSNSNKFDFERCLLASCLGWREKMVWPPSRRSTQLVVWSVPIIVAPSPYMTCYRGPDTVSKYRVVHLVADKLLLTMK